MTYCNIFEIKLIKLIERDTEKNGLLEDEREEIRGSRRNMQNKELYISVVRQTILELSSKDK
jgi:hypothetical protein